MNFDYFLNNSQGGTAQGSRPGYKTLIRLIVLRKRPRDVVAGAAALSHLHVDG